MSEFKGRKNSEKSQFYLLSFIAIYLVLLYICKRRVKEKFISQQHTPVKDYGSLNRGKRHGRHFYWQEQMIGGSTFVFRGEKITASTCLYSSLSLIPCSSYLRKDIKHNGSKST